MPDGGSAAVTTEVETDAGTVLLVLPENEATADGGLREARAVDQSVSGNGRVTLYAGAEAAFELMPSGPPGGGQDTMFDVTPMLGLEAGDDFGAQAGATFRLRVFDNDPQNRPNDINGVLRREDWDETSDFGQIIRQLRIGRLDSQVWVRAGPTVTKTMGLGHLINRYANRDNPNYHPASGNAALTIGPVRGEFFASDIFGARIFAGEVGVEFGQIVSKDSKWHDRFHLNFSLAHDAGRAGGITDAVTLLNLDFDAVLYRSAAARVMALIGMGSRVAGTADLGAVVGLAADTDLDGFLLGGKLEGRKQAGGYRQGYFGPAYELSRFAGTGFSGLPISAERLPDSFSFYGELRVGARGITMVELMVEHFVWGRTDLDATLNLTVWDKRIIGSARFTAVGMGQLPRYSTGGKLLVRLLPALYLVGEGGTIFFPQPDGGLSRGWYGSLGVGADIEKTF